MAEWESSQYPDFKKSPQSFIFSVNDHAKYPITDQEQNSIRCDVNWGPNFGNCELVIVNDSNLNSDSWCENGICYKLPGTWLSSYPKMNGGLRNFQALELEVFKVYVSVSIN